MFLQKNIKEAVAYQMVFKLLSGVVDYEFPRPRVPTQAVCEIRSRTEDHIERKVTPGDEGRSKEFQGGLRPLEQI